MVMDVEELGRRAVACRGWRWMKRMSARLGVPEKPGRAIVDDVRDGVPIRWHFEGDLTFWSSDLPAAIRWHFEGNLTFWLWREWSSDFPAAIPDLTDPATLGCLLALVREVLGCDVWLSPEWSGDERWWMVRRVSNHVACGPGGSTQAEALVLALVAADARLLHVEAMNAHQQRSDVHPYTCANRGDGRHDGEGKLVATFDGWVCPSCDYTQRYW